MPDELSLENSERRRLLLAQIAQLQWRLVTEFGEGYSSLSSADPLGKKRLWTLAAWIGILSLGPLMLLKDQYHWVVFVVICGGTIITSLLTAFNPAEIRLKRGPDTLNKIQFGSERLVEAKFEPEWNTVHKLVIVPVMSELEEDWLLTKASSTSGAQRRWIRIWFTLRWTMTALELVGILVNRLLGFGKREKKLTSEGQDRN